MDRIGIVGVGLMGHGIATNIAKHGYPLSLFEHPGNQPLDALIAAGAKTSASLAKIAENADIIILCVTGTPEIEAILLADNGLIHHIRPGTIIIDCSTAIPSSSEQIAARIEAVGAQFMDAAMTRTPKEAAEGRLNLTVGAPKALFERVLPLLKCYAENIVHAGPAGSGHKLKLIHNYVSLGFAAILAEAAACAAHASIDTAILLEVLGKGGGGGVVLERFRPYLERSDNSSLRFSMGNAFKDIGYYVAMAEDAGASHVTADGVLKTFETGVKSGDTNMLLLELVDQLGPKA